MDANTIFSAVRLVSPLPLADDGRSHRVASNGSSFFSPELRKLSFTSLLFFCVEIEMRADAPVYENS